MAKTLRRQVLPIYLTMVTVSVVAATTIAVASLLLLELPERVFGLITAGLVVAGSAWVAGRWVVDRISRPLVEMQAVAGRYADGDLEYRFSVDEPEEVCAIAESLHSMAMQLKTRMATMNRQRGELEGILSSMVEGVVVLDAASRVRSANTAAARLIGTTPEQAQGRSLLDVFRSVELAAVADEAAVKREPIERRITLYLEEPRIIQVHGSTLRSSTDPRPGTLLVLHDITRLKRLEDIRRDFVANVSHELKTPVTTIAGFVETLIEGAHEDPAQAEHFLGIVLQNANRLNAIIEDLLSLSRLEQADSEVPKALTDLRSIVSRVEENSSASAMEKGITIDHEYRGKCEAKVSASLIEQALMNLVDNAVKYSDEGTRVLIGVYGTEEGVEISVSDTGPGIVPTAVPRIFERFYRVDRARSRAMGGTGLGLAIVKHIALAHGGTVDVDSTVGAGSTFTIRLPGDN
ncbi:MAG: ATP-binding protein [Spirochaetota bacterium]